jgi:hypothetical protein
MAHEYPRLMNVDEEIDKEKQAEKLKRDLKIKNKKHKEEPVAAVSEMQQENLEDLEA